MNKNNILFIAYCMLFCLVVAKATTADTAAAPLKVAVFNATADCVTAGACNLFTDSTLWSDPNALANPSQFQFVIDLSADDSGIDLNVYTDLEIGDLSITGGQQTFLNINSSFSITSGSLYVSSVRVQLTNGASIAANAITLVDTSHLYLGQNSTVNSMINDTITADFSTNIQLYDNSTLFALQLNSYGKVGVSENAILYVQQASLALFTVGADASSHFSELTIANASNVLLGRVTATNLKLASASGTTTFSELGTIHLTLQSGATLAIAGDSNARYIYTPEDQPPYTTAIFTTNNATLTVGGQNAQVLNTQFNIGSGSVTLAIANATIVALNTTVPYAKNQLMFTLSLSGFAVIQSWLDFNGLVLIQENAIVDIQQNLVPTMCLENHGSVYIHKNVTCHQGNLAQAKTGTINMVDTPQLHLFKFFNNGTIVTHSTAQILGNLESTGTILIGADTFLNIVGYLDMLTDTAALTIAGITYNTDRAALSVLNIITLNGTLNYNVTPPVTNKDLTYKLLSTQLYFDKDFDHIIPDPSLATYKELKYVRNQKSIELDYKGKRSSNGGRDLGLVLGILIPLLIISIILTILFILYRRNKQYKFYTRIQ